MHLFTRIFLFHLLLIGTVQVTAQNKKSGNPILPGFHADPEVLYSHQTKRYYIYPTSDGFPGWGGSYFKVFSSKNLKHERRDCDSGDGQKCVLGKRKTHGLPASKKRR